LASILGQSCKSVGVFTSPHLEDLTERVGWVTSAGLEHVSRVEMQEAIEDIEGLCPNFEPLTFFEVITLAALLLISKRQPDFGVIEAGLGARLDATRVVDAEISILTDISIDHAQYLGSTLEEIAREKLAVIRPGRSLVAASSMPLVQQECERLDCRLYQLDSELRAIASGPDVWTFHLGDREIPNVQLGLRGTHQVRNALLAAQAAILLMPKLEEEILRDGLLRTRWPGRLEHGRTVSGVSYILDAAHNPAGAAALAAYLQGIPGAPWHFVFGGMADKAIAEILSPLIGEASTWSFTQGTSPRFMQGTEIKRCFESLGGRSGRSYDLPEAALLAACEKASVDGGTVVMCGSLFLIGELRAKLATAFERVLP